MPDFQCTLWPDVWVGISITDCCIAHDLGGSDLELAACVIQQFPPHLILFGLCLALIMFVGLKVFGPIYRHFKR